MPQHENPIQCIRRSCRTRLPTSVYKSHLYLITFAPSSPVRLHRFLLCSSSALCASFLWSKPKSKPKPAYSFYKPLHIRQWLASCRTPKPTLPMTGRAIELRYSQNQTLLIYNLQPKTRKKMMEPLTMFPRIY